MEHTIMNSRLRCRALFALVATLVGATASAQDRSAAIEGIFSWATPDCPGCAVAVSYHGQLVINRAYGSADLERDVPLSPDTIFDAASVTKQFVAAAVLLLVEDGRLSLSEDIRTYMPDFPDTGHTITLDQLLTHTSGIRDWTAILPLAAGDPDALTVVLRQRGLNFAPGEEWSYSNSGYVLLKEIVARTSGMPFSEFAFKRLFEPLGMESTQYLDDLREVVRGRALAYETEGGRWKLQMKLDNDRGGGGALFSTPSDLLIWNDALASGRLGEFVTLKLHEPARLNNGREIGYARGLFLGSYRGAKEVWHTGGSAGYGTWLGRYPEHDLSIAIMCNAGEAAEQTRYARQIFDLLVPDAGAAEPNAGPPPAMSDDDLVEVKSRAGLFVNDQTGEQIRLVVDRNRFRVAGGPGLVPVAKDRFRRWGAALWFMSGDEFELRFLSPDRFELISMEGAVMQYRRARPSTPAPGDLNGLAGRYESIEVGAVIQVEPRGDGLVIRLEHSPVQALEFKPVDTDTFQLSRVTVRFGRDEAGSVGDLSYSNPLVRNIKFTRIGDLR